VMSASSAWGGGDHTALVMITHEGIDRQEAQNVLCRRWPDVLVKELEQEEPAWAMTAQDAAALGRCRRGVEPLRVVVMPQHDRQVIAPEVEPKPVVVCWEVGGGARRAAADRCRSWRIGLHLCDRADHRHRSVPHPSDHVHKSPSLTVAESWFSTVVSTVVPTVPRTMCFQTHSGD
jgi:hypothetical protein